MPAYKSKFEATVHKIIGKKFPYEPEYIQFVQPEKTRKYLPDFKLRKNVYLEVKGKWTHEDRQKHLWLKEQHPEITIYLLFMSAFNKIRKGSRTTYADFCEKHGLKWADFKMGIPKSWLKQ